MLDWAWGPNRLTVLAYHRVNYIDTPDCLGLRYTVSASPEEFAQQMEYVVQHFNVIDIAALQHYVVDEVPLPPRPLLITFDDGYLDNYEHAYPILKKHGLPAVIFLITQFIGSENWPWWDEIAYCFAHTKCTHTDLPLLGELSLASSQERDAMLVVLLERLKAIPDAEKQAVLRIIHERLDVERPTQRLFVDWDQARELVAHGIDCQSHTASHPILTRVPKADLSYQLVDARVQLEAELGTPIYAFAYPNGGPLDYNETVLEALREADYTLAFTLTRGPIPACQIRKRPLLIPRVNISFLDNFPTFAMKATGLGGIANRLRL